MSDEWWVMSYEWWVMSYENWVTKKMNTNSPLIFRKLFSVSLKTYQLNLHPPHHTSHVCHPTTTPTNVPSLQWPTTASDRWPPATATTDNNHDFFFFNLKISYFYYICSWEMRKCEKVIKNIFFMAFSRTQPTL